MVEKKTRNKGESALSQKAKKNAKAAAGTSVKKRTPRNKLLVGGAAAFIVLLGLAFLFRSLFLAALVNGKPVFRWQVIRDLEKQGGAQALDAIITQKLIQQEADKKQVAVSQEQVNQELQQIKDQVASQEQDFNQLLQAQGLGEAQVKDQIRMRLILEELLANKVSVTDDEVATYMEENKDSMPESTDEATLKEQVKSQLTQQKLNQEIQQYVDKLKQEANILQFVRY